MYSSLTKKKETLDILNSYSGNNPFILRAKRDIILMNKTDKLTDFVCEYTLLNHEKDPIAINKTVHVADWYGEELKNKYNIEFVPEKLLIITYIGETKTIFHLMAKYRKNMAPMELFVSKKAILSNFLLDDYHKVQVDFDRFDRLSMAKDPNRKLKKHQKEAVQFLLSRKKCILADTMGLGKLQPLSTLLPTPYGFKRMGDIKEGDEVFDMDGKPVRVIKTFPHKDKEIYKVTFSDGSFTRCGMEHLWRVSNRNWKDKGWEVLSLQEITRKGLHNKISESMARQGIKKYNKWFIPKTQPVEYPARDFLIHPYILGMAIGDGSLHCGGIHISIPDTEIESVKNISDRLDEGYCLKRQKGGACPRYILKCKDRSNYNAYNREIKKLGLNVHEKNKFIPEIYKLSSIEQRKELLKGLMDSDGYITKTKNKISYSTSSMQLSKDVAELVCSLGGIARVCKYERNRNGKDIVEYVVRIQIGFCPFRLKRKAERYNPTFRKYLRRYIEKVEFDGIEDAQCIYVDSPSHTYISDKSYIVTHNTTSMSVSAIEGNFDAVLIICPASLKSTWKKELMWYVPEKDISVIGSYGSMTKPELEAFLGYGQGKSGKSIAELRSEAERKGKWEDNRFVIVNYDTLDEFDKIPSSRRKEAVEEAFKNSPMLQYIKDKKSLIIIDEAHRLSNSTSIRYKVIKHLITNGKPDSIYLATGTPITNNPQNLYCVLQLTGDPVADDWQYYMNRYCGAMKIPAKGEKEKWTNIFLSNKRRVGRNVNSYYDLTMKERDELKRFIGEHARKITIAKEGTNLDELRMRVSHIYLRRTKEDLDEELPPKTVHEVFYDFNETQREEYGRLWDEYEAAQLEADPDKEINKDLLEGAIYRRYCSNQMTPYTIRMADEFIKQGEKVIIATCYDDELMLLKDYYGDRCVTYNGKMNNKQKDAAQEEFMNNPEIKVFIGQIIAAGVGLTLTSARIMIFNNMSFVPGDNRQMEDRIHRIGQMRPVDVYYQMFRNTQYEKMWNIVLRKELLINQVIKKENEK